MTIHTGIELKSGEFPLDCVKPGVIIMQVNCQGIMEIGKQLRRFKHEFPKAYKHYVTCCIGGLHSPGDVEVFTENGFIIIFCFTKAYTIGKRSDTNIQVDKSLCEALSHMFFMYPDPTIFYSSPINYADSKILIQRTIEKHGHQWIVLKE